MNTFSILERDAKDHRYSRVSHTLELQVALSLLAAAWYKNADKAFRRIYVEDGYAELQLFDTEFTFAVKVYQIRFREGSTDRLYAAQLLQEAGVYLIHNEDAGTLSSELEGPDTIFPDVFLYHFLFDAEGINTHVRTRWLQPDLALAILIGQAVKNGDRVRTLLDRSGNLAVFCENTCGVTTDVWQANFGSETFTERALLGRALNVAFTTVGWKFRWEAYLQPDEIGHFDIFAFIEAFEAGEIQTEEELIEGLEILRDRGLLRQLQGNYGRTAARLGVI